MTLKFSDGVEFNTSGPLRVTRRSDGYYVTGKGLLVPVNSYKEGQDFIHKENNENATPKEGTNV
tara:strand:- start:192 stop:383 length:192 start_codon:yes stop_codon:yes gene_type:complete